LTNSDAATTKNRAAMQERLEAILRELPLCAEIRVCDAPLKRAANLLTYMAPKTQTAGRMPPMFRHAARPTCAKQIATLHRLAAKVAALAGADRDTARLSREAGKLAKHVAQLYQPTILALADTGFPGGERLGLQRAAEEVTTNPTLERREALASACRVAAECARRASVVNVRKVPAKGPPPKGQRRSEKMTCLLWRTRLFVAMFSAQPTPT
jgi:hypothetical protein